MGGEGVWTGWLDPSSSGRDQRIAVHLIRMIPHWSLEDFIVLRPNG